MTAPIEVDAAADAAAQELVRPLNRHGYILTLVAPRLSWRNIDTVQFHRPIAQTPIPLSKAKCMFSIQESQLHDIFPKYPSNNTLRAIV